MQVGRQPRGSDPQEKTSVLARAWILKAPLPLPEEVQASPAPRLDVGPAVSGPCPPAADALQAHNAVFQEHAAPSSPGTAPTARGFRRASEISIASQVSGMAESYTASSIAQSECSSAGPALPVTARGLCPVAASLNGGHCARPPEDSLQRLEATGVGATGIWWVETRYAAQHCTVPRTAPRRRVIQPPCP